MLTTYCQMSHPMLGFHQTLAIEHVFDLIELYYSSTTHDICSNNADI